MEPCSFGSPAENDFPKIAPRTANGHFGQNVSTLGAGSIPQLEVNVAIRLCSDIDDLTGDLIPLFLLRLLARRLVVQAGKWRPFIHIRRFYGLEHRCPSRYRGPLVFRFLSIRHMIVLASAWRREINGGLFFLRLRSTEMPPPEMRPAHRLFARCREASNCFGRRQAEKCEQPHHMVR